MKKILMLLLGVSFIIAGIPLLIHGWCCLDPQGHCANTRKIMVNEDGDEEILLIDENGNGVEKDSDGKCGNCHHAIGSHTCVEEPQSPKRVL